MNSFKEKYTEEERKSESQRIIEKYPNRIPIIVETIQVKKWFRNSEKLPDLDKRKYLVPADLTVGQFMYVLRKRIKLPAEKAMFMLFGSNKLLAPTSEYMNNVYEANKDLDGFLFTYLCSEDTFG